MAAEQPKRNLTIGGKGSSLTPPDVFSVSNQTTRVTIDSSITNPRSSKKNPTTNYSFSIPTCLSNTETRASLLILLNKLLLSNSVSAANLIFNILEQPEINNNDKIDLDNIVCNDVDFNSCTVIGVSALIDYLCGHLSVVADAVAAISCEAVGGDLSVFELADSGDGSSSKDVVAVAADFKAYFTGSKGYNLVNKVQSDCVKKIPVVYGNFRAVSKLLHSLVRVYLKSGFSVGAEEELGPSLLALGTSLLNLGETSLGRGKMVLEKVPEGLGKLECPGIDRLKKLCEEMMKAFLERDWVFLGHKVYELLDDIWKIVSWEGAVAFVKLEGSEIFGEKKASGSVTKDGSDVESVKKGDKKKKKVVLGKGSLAFTQFIKETLVRGEGNGGLEKFEVDFRALLDPGKVGFEGLIKKLKDIVESNDSRRLPKLPKGTRDFAEEMASRESLLSIITNVFKSHGAMALDTPVFEMREILTGKYGEDSKLIYDLADQGGELCSLRYDLTVPFARHVAMSGKTSFKRYQIAKVYRRDNPSKGRYREFFQCDFDIAGQFEKMGPDFEVIYILIEILNKLNIGDYEVKLNHRGLLDGMLAICGVPQAKFRTICSSIDKLDKQSFEQIKKEMVEEKGLTEEAADKIGAFVKLRGSPLELLSKLQEEGSELLQSSESKLALDELEVLFRTLDKSKCINKVVFDLSLARGLDYYTGVIFEAVFKGTTQVGSIAAGGRYDNLIGMFGSKQVPAVGISIGIERVFTIWQEQVRMGEKQEIRSTETQVLLCIQGDDLSLAGGLANELWSAGVKAEFSVNKRWDKHNDRRVKGSIPYMVFVGPNEMEKEVVRIRDFTAADTKDVVVPKQRFVEEVRRGGSESFEQTLNRIIDSKITE